MNQETRNLIDFIKNKEANLERLGSLQYDNCLLSLALVVEKQELYDRLEKGVNDLFNLLNEYDWNVLRKGASTYDYILFMGELHELLTSYASGVIAKKVFESPFISYDVTEQNTILDYVNLRMKNYKEIADTINGEDKDDA